MEYRRTLWTIIRIYNCYKRYKNDRNYNLRELFFSKSPAIRVTYQNTVLDIVISKINSQKRIFGARNEA